MTLKEKLFGKSIGEDWAKEPEKNCHDAVTEYRFYKENPSDKVWWVDMGEDVTGILAISFDKEKIYYLYRDYNKMTDEEKAIFNAENPFWDEFFNGKKGN